MKPKRVVFITILAFFVAFVAWRALHVPYRPDVLLRAIPSAAIFVSEHDGLSGRWPKLAASPMMGSLALSFGVEPEDYAAFRDNKIVAWAMNRFAARRTVIAYVPSFGAEGEPAWILTSWGGLHARMLQWGVYSSVLGDFEKQTFRGGRRGWVMRDLGEAFPDQYLSLAVADGALLAVLSSHPQGVVVPLGRIERDLPMAPEFVTGLQDRRDETTCLDRGWIAPGFAGDESWNYKLSLDRDGLTEASFQGGANLLPAAGELNAQARLDELIGVLKDSPSALVVGPFSLLKSALPETGSMGGIRFVADLLGKHASGGTDSFISLCNSDYSGRILNFKVSTLMIGVRLKERHESEAIVDAVLDKMNARFETTLIQRDAPSQGLRMKTIESVRKGPLSMLGSKERPACTMVGDWLFISSNRKALEKVRRKKPNQAGPWREELKAEPGHLAVWADLETAGKSLSKIAAVLDLVARWKGQGSESSPARQNLALAQQWIETLKPMGRLGAWGSSTTNACRARIRIGMAVSAADG